MPCHFRIVRLVVPLRRLLLKSEPNRCHSRLVVQVVVHVGHASPRSVSPGSAPLRRVHVVLRARRGRPHPHRAPLAPVHAAALLGPPAGAAAIHRSTYCADVFRRPLSVVYALYVDVFVDSAHDQSLASLMSTPS